MTMKNTVTEEYKRNSSSHGKKKRKDFVKEKRGRGREKRGKGREKKRKGREKKDKGKEIAKRTRQSHHREGLALLPTTGRHPLLRSPLDPLRRLLPI
jgi:hypothetical protein